jgi:hypothetical protein
LEEPGCGGSARPDLQGDRGEYHLGLPDQSPLGAPLVMGGNRRAVQASVRTTDRTASTKAVNPTKADRRSGVTRSVDSTQGAISPPVLCSQVRHATASTPTRDRPAGLAGMER